MIKALQDLQTVLNNFYYHVGEEQRGHYTMIPPRLPIFIHNDLVDEVANNVDNGMIELRSMLVEVIEDMLFERYELYTYNLEFDNGYKTDIELYIGYKHIEVAKEIEKVECNAYHSFHEDDAVITFNLKGYDKDIVKN